MSNAGAGQPAENTAQPPEFYERFIQGILATFHVSETNLPLKTLFGKLKEKKCDVLYNSKEKSSALKLTMKPSPDNPAMRATFRLYPSGKGIVSTTDRSVANVEAAVDRFIGLLRECELELTRKWFEVTSIQAETPLGFRVNLHAFAARTAGMSSYVPEVTSKLTTRWRRPAVTTILEADKVMIIGARKLTHIQRVITLMQEHAQHCRA